MHRGHLTADLPWLVLGTVLLSGGALTLWALLGPAVSPFLDTLRSMPPAPAVAGILVFALGNSACEEAVFTGAFLHELRGVLDVRIALGVQSLGFIPPGPPTDVHVEGQMRVKQGQGLAPNSWEPGPDLHFR